jgi:hypothetical protein
VVSAFEAEELLEGGAAHDAVDGEAGVALELPEGLRGGVTEDPVHPARVETQRAQALLQLGDVVTPQHRCPPVQEAVAHSEPRLHQGVPGLEAADAVDAQAAQALEGLERGPGARAEDAVGVDGRTGEDGGQAVLDVGDRITTVADGEGQAYR